MRESVLRRGAARSRGKYSVAEYLPRVPLWLEIAITVLVGVATGVLSGMFGIGGAVVSTPAIRALGATALQAIGSTLPSILPSSISGSLRYHRENFILWPRRGAHRPRSASRRRSSGSRLSRRGARQRSLR